jgi:acetyl-CoA acetyltransferase
MSSEVFVISAVHDANPTQAIRRAIETVGVKPLQVQDVVFAFESAEALADPVASVRAAGLKCPVVSVSSGLRAIFFSAASILSGEADLTIVVGIESKGASALVLAAPEAVGRWNLMPRARLAKRSLGGAEAALRAEGIAAGDVRIMKQGDSVVMAAEAIDELERRSARWGMVMQGELVLLVERA